MTVHKITGAYPAGLHVLQTRDQSNLLVLKVDESKIQASYQQGGGTPLNETIIALLGSDQLPAKTYIAMAMGGKSEKKGQTYNYYPFHFGKNHVEWLKPADSVQFFGLSDLASHVRAADQAGGLSFDLVAPDKQDAVLARFAAWHESRKEANKSNKKSTTSSTPPAVETRPTVKGFTVGDGVYVQGVFSDSPSIIREIDQTNRRVKVQRYQDGVSEWVGFDSIISRDQSSANDVGRGAAAVGLFVCMMSPDTCKKKPK